MRIINVTNIKNLDQCSSVRSWEPLVLHVLDVSLLQHTRLKWSARHRALLKPDSQPFVWIRFVANILKHEKEKKTHWSRWEVWLWFGCSPECSLSLGELIMCWLPPVCKWTRCCVVFVNAAPVIRLRLYHVGLYQLLPLLVAGGVFGVHAAFTRPAWHIVWPLCIKALWLSCPPFPEWHRTIPEVADLQFNCCCFSVWDMELISLVYLNCRLAHCLTQLEFLKKFSVVGFFSFSKAEWHFTGRSHP